MDGESKMKKDFVIVLAPDSFKESMSAKEACIAMERGIKKVNQDINVYMFLWQMVEKELCNH